jgi:hypothetical protein
MNKLLISTIVACGLLLLDSPEAAAHDDGHQQKRYSDRSYSRSYDRDHYSKKGYRGDRYYASKYQRSGNMPRWLRKDHSFKRWYGHSRLRYDRYLSWERLFDVYRWEHSPRRYSRYQSRY